MRGVPSVFNKGNKLKRSLICPDKVNNFIAGYALQNQDSNQNLQFLNDTELSKGKQWKLVLDYFKKNPSDLLDAFTTPKQELDLYY
jgi:hypothetical protein